VAKLLRMPVDWQGILTGIAVALAAAHVFWCAVKTIRLPEVGNRCGSCRGCAEKPASQMLQLVHLRSTGASHDNAG
jgi:hypothetical protein